MATAQTAPNPAGPSGRTGAADLAAAARGDAS
jgi:hypothetical protein